MSGIKPAAVPPKKKLTKKQQEEEDERLAKGEKKIERWQSSAQREWVAHDVSICCCVYRLSRGC
jgi:hypothetical protein